MVEKKKTQKVDRTEPFRSRDDMSQDKSPDTDGMDAVTEEHVQKEETEPEEVDVTEGDTREKHPSGTGSEGGEEGPSDESAPLLPRRTKVLVTGNNRTKSSLVGLEGYVKKAVGLGGWHWLVRDRPVGRIVPLDLDVIQIIDAERFDARCYKAKNSC